MVLFIYMKKNNLNEIWLSNYGKLQGFRKSINITHAIDEKLITFHIQI